MNTKLVEIACLLLKSACSFSYIKKFFATPKATNSVFLKDKDDRIVIYHGVNVSNFSKGNSSYLPWQTKEDFARLKTWGFNLVRYLVFWKAIEPNKGQYNGTYIQQTIQRIQWLKELGIDVVIDMHQDLYSNKFTGNGFPDWTIKDEGLDFIQKIPWNINYFEPAVIASYNNFWKSDDLKKSYIEMLEYVISKFDDFENVIGIDVMNEPFLGTISSFEKNTLTKFYDNIQEMMIKNNFRMEMGFEPMMYTSGGIPTNLQFLAKRDCFYFPHYYDALCHEGRAYSSFNKFILKRAMAIKLKEAQEFNVPLMIGEFGISQKIENYSEYLKDFVKIANENLIGWTYYTHDYKCFDDFGILNDDNTPSDILKHIVCVYPQKIAGTNPKILYSDNTFLLTYNMFPGSTEIFIPDLKNVKVLIDNSTEVSVTPNSVFIHENKCTNLCSTMQSIQITWDK